MSGDWLWKGQFPGQVLPLALSCAGWRGGKNNILSQSKLSSGESSRGGRRRIQENIQWALCPSTRTNGGWIVSLLAGWSGCLSSQPVISKVKCRSFYLQSSEAPLLRASNCRKWGEGRGKRGWGTKSEAEIGCPIYDTIVRTHSLYSSIGYTYGHLSWVYGEPVIRGRGKVTWTTLLRNQKEIKTKTFRIEKKTCRIEGNFNDYQTIGDVYDFDSKSLLKVEWLWSSLNGEQ